MAEKGMKGRKKSAFLEFFKKNKSMTVLLPLLLIAILFLIIVYSGFLGKSKPASAIPSQNNGLPENLTGHTVEILPQMQRITQPDVSAQSQSRDPFSSSGTVLVLKGITLSEDNTAIIETENSVHIVSAGDIIEETWNVEEIREDGVVLKGKEGTETLLSYEQ